MGGGGSGKMYLEGSAGARLVVGWLRGSGEANNCLSTWACDCELMHCRVAQLNIRPHLHSKRFGQHSCPRAKTITSRRAGRWPNLSLFTPAQAELSKGPLCHGYLKQRQGLKYPLGTLDLIYVIMELSLLVPVRVCTVSLESKWQL